MSRAKAKFRKILLLSVLLVWSRSSLGTHGWVLKTWPVVGTVLWSGPSSIDEGDRPVVGQREGFVRYRGRVAYDGSNFQGFQIQLNGNARTIQASLEEVLQKRFNRPTIRVVGAGRTDSGVSARGQAFHFDLPLVDHEQLHAPKQNKTQPPLHHAMNRMLSDEIQVWNVGPAPLPQEKTLEVEDEASLDSVTTTTTRATSRRYAWKYS